MSTFARTKDSSRTSRGVRVVPMLSKIAVAWLVLLSWGVFGLFLAGRRSLIGKPRDQPGKPLTQSPHGLPLSAGRLDAAPLS